MLSARFLETVPGVNCTSCTKVLRPNVEAWKQLFEHKQIGATTSLRLTSDSKNGEWHNEKSNKGMATT